MSDKVFFKCLTRHKQRSGFAESGKNGHPERNNKQTLGTPTGLIVSQSFKEVLGIREFLHIQLSHHFNKFIYLITY